MEKKRITSRSRLFALLIVFVVYAAIGIFLQLHGLGFVALLLVIPALAAVFGLAALLDRRTHNRDAA